MRHVTALPNNNRLNKLSRADEKIVSMEEELEDNLE